jgi:hypothetical protein
MEITCRNPACGNHFAAQRASARYCSDRCRVAAHRRRHLILPATSWYDGKTRRFASRAGLAQGLLVIAVEADDGEAKTGRRYYYLVLSRGILRPDMSATAVGKRSRDAAYDAVIDVLGKLRMNGDLDWSRTSR